MVNKITTPPTTSELIGTVNEIIDDKQDTISDLATIRSGASLGATAVQPSDLSTYVTTNTAQDITARKTFFGEKAIYFKQNTTSDKLGFTLYNNNNKEVGALEFRPSTIGGTPILTLNSSSPNSTSYVGFRYWSYSLNIIAPFSTSLRNKNLFIPVTFTNGTTTVESTSTDGSVNISSLLPTKTSDLTNDSGYITSSALNGYATESYVTTAVSGKQDTLVSGTNIKTINNTSLLGSGDIDVLTNSESGTNTLGILSSPDSYNWSNSVVIGVNSKVKGGSSVAIGYDARTTDYYSTAIGYDANSAYSAIQLGYGTNSTRSTFCVGFFRGTDNQSHNWELLNGTTGLIPSARIAIDGTSITVNSSGQLQASGGGGSLPSQTGHAGEFLKTDGTDTSWAVATTITFMELS